jgi:hypothetical protein
MDDILKCNYERKKGIMQRRFIYLKIGSVPSPSPLSSLISTGEIYDSPLTAGLS